LEFGINILCIIIHFGLDIFVRCNLYWFIWIDYFDL